MAWHSIAFHSTIYKKGKRHQDQKSSVTNENVRNSREIVGTQTAFKKREKNRDGTERSDGVHSETFFEFNFVHKRILQCKFSMVSPLRRCI